MVVNDLLEIMREGTILHLISADPAADYDLVDLSIVVNPKNINGALASLKNWKVENITVATFIDDPVMEISISDD